MRVVKKKRHKDPQIQIERAAFDLSSLGCRCDQDRCCRSSHFFYVLLLDLVRHATKEAGRLRRPRLESQRVRQCARLARRAFSLAIGTRLAPGASASSADTISSFCAFASEHVE